MRPVDFKGSNAIFAKDQPQYLQLPAHVSGDDVVTSCWRLTWRERFKVLLFGCFWWQQMTFGYPLQPQRPSIDRPEF